ncbi:DUF2076 domain-containing protein [Brenneria populi]|uniref:DUF2076 domain-containing protein n=1 Tax=Brenneria populi TaxID=1505588 RepID=A0ABU6JRZ1_9GAMM|nr:DUF2076 domain-containing protein [Brenneria populi Li et al. 2015]
MQAEEQRLIDGLFSRLKETEAKTGARDLSAEQQISEYVRRQPAAPYYMAQALIIQEAALKQMDQRVKELESEVAQLRQSASRPSGGGFLSGLFGGGRSAPSAPAQYGAPSQQPNYSQPNYAPAAQPSRAGGFIGGALQTAAGVAGGVMLADMLTGMFHRAQPEEIVNIINETPLDGGLDRNLTEDANLDTFNHGDAQWENTGNEWQGGDAPSDDFSSDFGSDDDGSFL